MTDVEVCALGFRSCTACAPAGAAAGEVTAEVNRQYPTGTQSRWAASTPDPGPCQLDPDRRHWVLKC